MSQENKPEEQTKQETPDQNQEAREAVDAILSKIDYDTLSKDDVFHDIMHQAKLFAFRLMVGAALLEQLLIRERAKAEQAAADQPEAKATEEPKVEILPDPPKEDDASE